MKKIEIKPEQLVKLQRTLGSDSSIASSLGVSRITIIRLRKEYGIGPFRKGDNTTTRNKCIEMRSKGASYETLTRIFKVSRTTIYRWLKQ